MRRAIPLIFLLACSDPPAKTADAPAIVAPAAASVSL